MTESFPKSRLGDKVGLGFGVWGLAVGHKPLLASLEERARGIQGDKSNHHKVEIRAPRGGSSLGFRVLGFLGFRV